MSDVRLIQTRVIYDLRPWNLIVSRRVMGNISLVRQPQLRVGDLLGRVKSLESYQRAHWLGVLVNRVGLGGHEVLDLLHCTPLPVY